MTRATMAQPARSTAAKRIRVASASLYLLPVRTRVPLKFGHETLTSVTCARVRLTVRDETGRRVEGWGETPLSVQWVWPSDTPYPQRLDALIDFAAALTRRWAHADLEGDVMQVGHGFLEHELPAARDAFNREHRAGEDPLPHLAALVCCSPFDLALHDAWGRLWDEPTYATYDAAHLADDLSRYLEPEPDIDPTAFTGRFPADLLDTDPPRKLPAWHLVGGLDPIDPEELTGDEPDDGYPVLLADWIRRDGLTCLKIKLRGSDPEWDLARLIRVGEVAEDHGVEALSADFNCTAPDVACVTGVLDRLRERAATTFDRLLYVEQPFPYDLEANRLDVHEVSRRKPLFLDESAHDWRVVRLGRRLGWTGVALKTCKTQTGALLSLAWARAHGMQLMVQDLTNPMLAQVPHVLLAAHARTIRGVETNAMQFYPDASAAEQRVHPGLYQRRDGCVDWSTVRGPGFGYRLEEIDRALPPAHATASAD